jgi:hypothetical protein
VTYKQSIVWTDKDDRSEAKMGDVRLLVHRFEDGRWGWDVSWSDGWARTGYCGNRPSEASAKQAAEETLRKRYQ